MEKKEKKTTAGGIIKVEGKEVKGEKETKKNLYFISNPNEIRTNTNILRKEYIMCC